MEVTTLTGKVVAIQGKKVSHFSSTTTASYTPPTRYTLGDFRSYTDVSVSESHYHRIFILTERGETSVTIPDSLDIREGHVLTMVYDTERPVWAVNETTKARAFINQSPEDQCLWSYKLPNLVPPVNLVWNFLLTIGVVMIVHNLIYYFSGSPWYLLPIFFIMPFSFYYGIFNKNIDIYIPSLPRFNSTLLSLHRKWARRYHAAYFYPILLVIVASLILSVIMEHNHLRFNSKWDHDAAIILGYICLGVIFALPAGAIRLGRTSEKIIDDLNTYYRHFEKLCGAILSSEEHIAEVERVKSF